MHSHHDFSKIKFCAGSAENPSDETINHEVPCVYMHAKRSHIHVKDPVYSIVYVRVVWVTVYVRVWWITENTKITQRTPTVSGSDT